MKNPLDQISLLRTYAKSIGWGAAISLRFSDFRARMGVSKGALLKFRIKNAQYPLLMRIGSSDREVLAQIFIEREYEPIAVESPRTILDLGANVGYSSAYFLSKYPDATVLAVEPDPGNYAMCRRNLEPYGSRARVIHGAVWPERRKLVMDRGAWRDGREWTAQVKPAKEESTPSEPVEGYAMATLIGLSGGAEIDLLKIDIEEANWNFFHATRKAGCRASGICASSCTARTARPFFRGRSQATLAI